MRSLAVFAVEENVDLVSIDAILPLQPSVKRFEVVTDKQKLRSSVSRFQLRDQLIVLRSVREKWCKTVRDSQQKSFLGEMCRIFLVPSTYNSFRWGFSLSCPIGRLPYDDASRNQSRELLTSRGNSRLKNLAPILEKVLRLTSPSSGNTRDYCFMLP